MASLNVFQESAFSTMSLTAAINKLPYQPSRLGNMGLFNRRPIRTTVAMIEEQHGKLALIPTAARGTEPTAKSRRDRAARAFNIPHLPLSQEVLADDVQNIRAFGSESELEAVSTIVNNELEAQRQDHETTHEFYRTGAIQGIVYDADGVTVQYNWFEEFGINEAEITIDFNNADLNFKKIAQQAIRLITDNLGGSSYSGVHCMVGSSAWDAFVTHASVENAFDRWRDGEFLRDDHVYGTFNFAGIDWENYRGGIDDIKFIPDDVFRFFPKGTRDIFIEVNAPADFMETVNTMGLPVYAKQERIRFDKGVELHTQSNVMMFCTRPASLVKGTGTNVPAVAAENVKPAQAVKPKATTQKK